MSTPALNQVLKYGVLGIEEAPLVTSITDGTSIPVSCKVMTTTPFVVGQEYTIRDDSWGAGANGLPNAERFVLSGIQNAVSPALTDGIGYYYDATLIASSALSGNYSTTLGASVYIPGVEMALQSSDFNCRFKTISDAPKIDPDDEASRIATGDEGRDVSIMGARSGEISFTEKMAWAGAVTTIPVWDKLMRTMGHLKKVYGSTGIEYIPTTYSNEITATIWLITAENGLSPSSICYRYRGCHGGAGSTIGAGKIGDPYMITGKYSGAYVGNTEFTLAQARAFTSNFTQIPEVMLNNTCTVPAWVNSAQVSKEIDISQWTLDFGGTVNPFIDQSTSTGNAYYSTSDRDPKLTVNPYHVKKSLEDTDYVISNMLTGEVLIKSALSSPHITITVPQAQLLQPTLGSREGYMSQERTYRCLRNNLGNGAIEATLPDGAMYGILIGARA